VNTFPIFEIPRIKKRLRKFWIYFRREGGGVGGRETIIGSISFLTSFLGGLLKPLYNSVRKKRLPE
jgi:hypothetical protein